MWTEENVGREIPSGWRKHTNKAWRWGDGGPAGGQVWQSGAWGERAAGLLGTRHGRPLCQFPRDTITMT